MFFLHLRNELWKLFGKKRTYIGFGAFVIAQNAILLLFHFSRWQRGFENLLAGNGYVAREYISALTVAVLLLLPQVLLLMPLYTALVGGDLVAKEAEDGTLRMILSRPVSRFNLLLAKWMAGGIFSVVLVAVLGFAALGFARIWFPWGKMAVHWPPLQIFSLVESNKGLRFYMWSHLFMALNALTVLSLGFMFSCFNMKPAAATILALSFVILNLVMEAIPLLERFHEYLLPYHFRIWLLIYQSPIQWQRITQSAIILAAFSITTFLIGSAAFHARDIKS
jgi:ABC-2 type transport system permease protein